jgi:putative SOS response-associated peptidase YedK
MCNLYSLTKNQTAIRDLFKVDLDTTGNLPSMPGIFLDKHAPIVRNSERGRELALVRWGMPSSSQALFKAAKKLEAKGKAVDFKELLRMEPYGSTTNIRNVKSKHWTRWLGPENVARGMPSLSSVRLAGRCDCSTSSMISAFSDAGCRA